MKYEFQSLEESGTYSEYILAYKQKPNWLERCLGKREERIACYGHDRQWHSMDGLQIDRPTRRELWRMWNEHLADVTGANV